MYAIRKMVLEALILAVIGVLVAVTVNVVRASGSITFTRNYFDKGLGRNLPTPNTTLVTSPNQVVPMTGSESPSGASAESGTSQPATDAHVEHPYQMVTFDEVVAIFNDPNTASGANVFVDARNKDAYEDGHIPGAIQADHYQLEDCIGPVLDYAESAEKIIVYCAGGMCEDSIFLCCDLVDFEIPCDRIYLYHGGWDEWSKSGMPIAKGWEED